MSREPFEIRDHRWDGRNEWPTGVFPRTVAESHSSALAEAVYKIIHTTYAQTTVAGRYTIRETSGFGKDQVLDQIEVNKVLGMRLQLENMDEPIQISGYTVTPMQERGADIATAPGRFVAIYRHISQIGTPIDWRNANEKWFAANDVETAQEWAAFQLGGSIAYSMAIIDTKGPADGYLGDVTGTNGPTFQPRNGPAIPLSYRPFRELEAAVSGPIAALKSHEARALQSGQAELGL